MRLGVHILCQVTRQRMARLATSRPHLALLLNRTKDFLKVECMAGALLGLKYTSL